MRTFRGLCTPVTRLRVCIEIEGDERALFVILNSKLLLAGDEVAIIVLNLSIQREVAIAEIDVNTVPGDCAVAAAGQPELDDGVFQLLEKYSCVHIGIIIAG